MPGPPSWSYAESMANIAARAFDDFAAAHAAANELRCLGLGGHAVQITSNPRNPDGLPGISLADEAERMSGILEKMLVNLFEIDDARDTIRGRIEALRSGGVIVAVYVADDHEQEAAQDILHRYRGVDLEYETGGYPIY
jgi:hypothetical protein